MQSVALRLLCEREAAVEAFRSVPFWTVSAALATAKGEPVRAALTHLSGRRLGKLDLGSADSAEAAADMIRRLPLTVKEVVKRPQSRAPPPPFTTSTMQQAASTRLGLSASVTMMIAQRLYEGSAGGDGLITYHRTDGVQVSADAVDAIREAARARYGGQSVPPEPRAYVSKQKNAQEAHEAIRPTDPKRTPAELADTLSRDELRLYSLVWRRAVASQMVNAEYDMARTPEHARHPPVVRPATLA